MGPPAISVSERSSVVEQVIAVVKKRFYDPGLHEANLKAAFDERNSDLMKCSESAFAAEMEKTLSVLRANPLRFYHKSQQRVPARWAIRATFRSLGEHPCLGWVFQDVAPGGPAYNAGFKSGDVLLGINGRPVDCPEFLVGHNEVTVQKRNGQIQKNNFIAPLQTPVPAVFHSTLNSSTGYLRLTHLPGLAGIDLARDIDRAVSDLSTCSSLIVDLRGNPGGGTGGLRLMSYLTPDRIPVGYSLTRQRAESGYSRERLTKFRGIPGRKWVLPFLALKYRFIDHSVVVVTEGLGKQRFHGNVVMLVNEHTISGAEIIAGFASDHSLATIVGTTTAGTLLGWRSFPIEPGYVLVIPTGNYLTWEGKSFEGKGIQPQVEVPFDINAAREGQDTQLLRAIKMVQAA